MENSPDSILQMFIRPSEPLFMPKGKEKVVFCVPEDYMPKRYFSNTKAVAEYFERDDNHKIHIDAIDVDDLEFTLQLGREDQFSVFIPSHAKIAGVLIGIFMSKKTYKEFLSAAAYCRDRINPHLFIYALSVAILHRSDTENLTLPSLSSVFPHLFINGVGIKKAKEEINGLPEHCRKCITIEKDFTASNLDIEHRVAYFREDLGVNLHHYHWHIVYPHSVENYPKIVAKDRRGELFYYMHQQIIGRYNFERLSNNLVRVKSLNCWRQPMTEGYFSKLGADSSANFYPGRHSGAILKDVDRPDGRFEILDLERLRDRIFEAIHRRSVIDADGNCIDLDDIHGIDILGNIIEASILSPNPTLYGSLHNQGHVAIATCHDPDNRHLESISVMGNNTTAMRDPIFYRWHAFIDDIFQAHKNLLKPYTNEQLEFKEVKINGVEILTPGDDPTSTFHTHWQQSDVEISGGLDYNQSSGSISVRFTHLNHQPFSYAINVENKNEEDKMGTVRIFMAPSHDERGYDFALDKQRKLMIELDKFTVTLKPGIHTIIRRSDESSVTVPFERTFPTLDKSNSIPEITKQETNWCGCGWPQHMLIPRGNKEGFSVDLFVMVSDYSVDKVDQGPTTCKNAASFCGLKDKKYPDVRSMGYPFDRPLKTEKITFDQFMTGNMRRKQMKIIFTDEIKEISREINIE